MSRNGDNIAQCLQNIREILYAGFIERRISDEEYKGFIGHEMRAIERSLKSMRSSGINRDLLTELEGIKRAAVDQLAFSSVSLAGEAYLKFVNSIDIWNPEVSRTLRGLSIIVCERIGRCKCFCLDCLIQKGIYGHERGPHNQRHCGSHGNGCHMRCE